jgi:hypothetical protein
VIEFGLQDEDVPGAAALGDIVRRHFTSEVLSARSWLLVARELLDAASLIEPAVRTWSELAVLRLRQKEVGFPPGSSLFPPYLLLSAFALENLFKSRIAGSLSAEEVLTMRNTGALPSRIRGHNLEVLARAAGFPLTELDAPALERLSKAVTWGRYPVQVTSNDQDALGSLSRQIAAICAPTEVDMVKALIARVFEWASEGAAERVSRQP